MSADKRKQPFLPTGARQAGVSLVELIIFILVAAIAGVGLMAAYTGLMRSPPLSIVNTVATQLAQERMELILARRRAVGFATFNDPCPGPPICTLLNPGYTVNATISAPSGAPAPFNNANHREITVTVTTGAPPVSLVILRNVVARY